MFTLKWFLHFMNILKAKIKLFFNGQNIYSYIIVNCAVCFNACKFIKYILKTKTSLKWSIYSFKIDLHVLKVLKTSLEVKIWKNKSATFDWLQVVDRIECS